MTAAQNGKEKTEEKKKRKGMKRLLFILGMAFLSPTLSAQRLEEGLVFYAPFDASTINLVGWEKPSNQGHRFVADKRGQTRQAVAFNGQTDYLLYHNPFLPSKDASLSVWLKPNPIPPNATNELMTWLANWGLNDGQWHHLIGIKQGDSLQIWVDQSAIPPTLVAAAADLFAAMDALPIGAFFPPTLGQQYYEGLLDELRLYNRRLSTDEMQLLFKEFEAYGPPSKPTAATVNMTVYPNPTSRLLQLSFAESAERRISILDEQGRQLRYLNTSSASEQINVAGLLPGTYVVSVREKDRVYAKKFIKTGAVLP